ncbi:MAG: hypothetical protein Q7S44_02870 [bacterium]|nr:hypothetical protein [bacterium]
MKIVVLTGPGEVGKRGELLKIKQQFALENITQLDLKQVGLGELITSLSSRSLFESGKRLVVAENTPEKFDLEELGSIAEEVILVLVTAALRSDSKLLHSAKKIGARVVSFEGEKELSAFPFLDSLLEGKKEAFLELQKLLEEYGGMYILTMIYYGLRRNILPLPASGFVRKKILLQKERFSNTGWQKLYYLVLDTESSIKSGLLPEDVALTKLTQAILERN